MAVGLDAAAAGPQTSFMLQKLTRPFRRNDFGHRNLDWSRYVKGDLAARRRYAERLEAQRPDWRSRRPAPSDIDAAPAFHLDPAAAVAAVPPGAIPGTEAAVAEGLARSAETTLDPKKPFIRDLMLSPERLKDSPALLAFATEPSLIAALSGYLGCVPILHYVAVWISQEAHGPNAASQLLHCDADDMHNMALFLYCSEVGPDNGPFTAFRGDASDRIGEEIGYRFGGEKYRVDDEAVARHRAAGAETRVMGPPGTLAVADTARCFHQGSRVADGAAPRIAVTFRFLTPNAFFWPPETGYRDAAPYRVLATPDMPKLTRAVLGAD